MTKKKEISAFNAAMQFKCPACRKGHIFTDKQHYAPFSYGSGQHNKCPNCDQDFEIEPGFEFGAYYISYAINVIYFGLATLFAFLFLNPDDIYSYVYFDVAIVIIALPFTIRFSRVLNLHLIGGIKYNDKDKL